MHNGMLILAILCLFKSTASLAAPPASANIILVSIDGLRFDRTTLSDPAQPTTPNLLALAKEGVQFSRTFSQSNGSLYSHAAMFTGQMPTEIAQARYLEYIVPPAALTLPEALSAIGFATGGFIAGGHISERFGFAQGFDTFESGQDFGSFFETVPMALSWIRDRQADTPWFAFIHGYDCHRPFAHKGLFWHPTGSDYVGLMDQLVDSAHETERIFNGVYYPDANLAKAWHVSGNSMLDAEWYTRLSTEGTDNLGQGIPLNQSDLAHLKTHYDSGVLVADTYIGLLADQLQRSGVWDNTIVIITSDHGEDLQDHGFTNHRAVLHDSTTQVPFIITGGAVPERLKGTVFRTLVDALDLAPTIMGIAASVPPAKARGRDLWAALKEGRSPGDHTVLQQGVLGQTSLRTPTHRFTFSGLEHTDPNYLKTLATAPLDSAHFSLFELKVDPGEIHNIIADDPALADKLRAVMLQRCRALSTSTASKGPSEETLQMLQSRGYW